MTKTGKAREHWACSRAGLEIGSECSESTTPRPEFNHSVDHSSAIRIFTASICQPVNPGGLGCWAFVAYDNAGAEIAQQAGCLFRAPDMSNNHAAYTAIIKALRWAVRSAAGAVVEILTPVKFIADQVNGAAECNADHLRPLRDEAVALLTKGNFKLTWSPKETVQPARRLAEWAYRDAARIREKERN
jgi:ribonuclease HI